MTNESNLTRVCTTSEIEDGEIAQAEIGDLKVAVYNLGGKFFATQNVCPHAYALLGEGFVEDGCIECPLHAALFDIETGEVRDGPTETSLCTYNVEIRGDEVFVDVPDGSKPNLDF